MVAQNIQEGNTGQEVNDNESFNPDVEIKGSGTARDRTIALTPLGIEAKQNVRIAATKQWKNNHERYLKVAKVLSETGEPGIPLKTPSLFNKVVMRWLIEKGIDWDGMAAANKDYSVEEIASGIQDEAMEVFMSTLKMGPSVSSFIDYLTEKAFPNIESEDI